MPKSIVSDRGSTFTSFFWNEFFKLQGVNLSYSSAYYSQSDGQTEAMNKCLEHFLRFFLGDKPRLWFEWYNTTFHASTELTLYAAIYEVPCTRLQAYIPRLSPNQVVEELLKTQEQILDTLKNNLVVSHERMKLYFDK